MYIVRETLESAALAAAVHNATDADRAHVGERQSNARTGAVQYDEPQAYHRQSREFHIGADPAVAHAPADAHAGIRLEHNRTRAADGACRALPTRAVLHEDHGDMLEAFLAGDVDDLLAASDDSPPAAQRRGRRPCRATRGLIAGD